MLLVMAALGWPTTAFGQWRANVRVDPVTEASSRYATVTSSGSDSKLTLVLQCGLLARLSFESTSTVFHIGGEGIVVDIWIDRNDPMSARFVANSAGTGGATTRDEVLQQLLPQMRAGTTMVLRVADYRGVAYDYSFTLSGFTAATSRLECLQELESAGPSSRTRIVGDLLSKFWYRIDDPCWRTSIPEPARVFFASLDGARAAGYDRPGPPCQATSPGR